MINLFAAQSDSVYDAEHNLLWQDSFSNALNKMSFKRALSYCDTLKQQNINKWRLPNNTEFTLIIDNSRIPTIQPSFHYSGVGCYWSYSHGQIGNVDFKEGIIHNTQTNNDQECFVRCIYDE